MMKKKIYSVAWSLLIGLCSACGFVYAQAANDGFVVPLDQDFSNASGTVNPLAASGDSGSGGAKSPVSMGLWVETTGKATSLIRDIKTGEKSGYEFDNAHFLSNANWWFWGDFGKKFQLDAEISVWNFDKTLYQANTYGSLDPVVGWKQGLQGIVEMPFSLMKTGNDNGIGNFNKMGFTVKTPVVNTKIGYGGVKGNGMSKFTGIFNVLDRWDDVGKGFTEISNGSAIQSFGDFKLNAVSGFSMMRGTYGFYDLLDVSYGDLVNFVATFGSTTGKENLFDYGLQNDNGVSAYVKVSPFDGFSVEVHGAGTFGTETKFGKDTIAGAVRLGYANDLFSVSGMESYAGENAATVWGNDDSLGVDTLTTDFDFAIAPLDFLSLMLEEDFVMNDVDKIGKEKMTSRSQINVDLDFNPLLEKDFVVGLYGTLGVDRIATNKGKAKGVVWYMPEAGVEIVASEVVPFVKKLTFDYAVSIENNESAWEKGDSFYSIKKCYNSFMINADVNERFNVHAGALIRTDGKGSKDKKTVPYAASAGFSIANIPLPGSPKFWMHGTYGMNPYEDNNYSLYRADDPQNNAPHRTYLLNSLEEDTTKSEIALGLIWNL